MGMDLIDDGDGGDGDFEEEQNVDVQGVDFSDWDGPCSCAEVCPSHRICICIISTVVGSA